MWNLVAEPLTPAGPARPARRGRWRWAAAAPFVVLAALLVSDRLLVRAVEHRLTGRLGCAGALVGTRSVHIGGFPFLTQLATGHFRTVTATADGIGSADRLTDVAVTFRDVRVPVWSALAGRWHPGSLSVGSVSATAVLRLGAGGQPLLAGQGGAPSQTLAAGAGAAGGTATPATSGQPATAAPPVLPPGAQLSSVEPVPGGLRLAVTIPGGMSGETVGRLCRG